MSTIMNCTRHAQKLNPAKAIAEIKKELFFQTENSVYLIIFITSFILWGYLTFLILYSNFIFSLKWCFLIILSVNSTTVLAKIFLKYYNDMNIL